MNNGSLLNSYKALLKVIPISVQIKSLMYRLLSCMYLLLLETNNCK
jgi:hypothetical protein